MRFALIGLSNFYTNEIGKSFTIGALPAGFIPTRTVIYTCSWNHVSDTSWAIPGVVVIFSDGVIKISSSKEISADLFDRFVLGVEFDVV